MAAVESIPPENARPAGTLVSVAESSHPDILIPRREERIGGQPQQILGWGMLHHRLRQRPSNNAASVCKPEPVPFLGPYPPKSRVLGQHAVGSPTPCHALTRLRSKKVLPAGRTLIAWARTSFAVRISCSRHVLSRPSLSDWANKPPSLKWGAAMVQQR